MRLIRSSPPVTSSRLHLRLSEVEMVISILSVIPLPGIPLVHQGFTAPNGMLWA
jgi:hypothetical protein